MELRLARQRESIAQNLDGTNQDDRMLGQLVPGACQLRQCDPESLSDRCRLLHSLCVHAYCAEIYDMAGLGFGQFHRRGLKMLSASIGLGTACVYRCSPIILFEPGYSIPSWFDDAHVSVCSSRAAQANYPEDLCQTYSAPCHS